MRKRFAKVLSLMLAMLVAVGMTGGVFATEANPDNLRLEVDSTTIYVGQSWFEIALYDDAEYEDDDEVLSLNYTVTSSNPKVVSVNNKNGWWNYVAKAAGKATLKVNYTYGDKTGTLSKVITVKNNPKALKSLKINGKKVKLKKNKWSFEKKIKNAKSVKVKAVPAKGWKISSVSAWAFTKNSSSGKKIKITKKAVKKGSKIKLAKKYKYLDVYVELYNKSKKEYMGYVIGYYR